ncbi:hypothetical protein LguiA_004284 [Lonicera macranthoides]
MVLLILEVLQYFLLVNVIENLPMKWKKSWPANELWTVDLWWRDGGSVVVKKWC